MCYTVSKVTISVHIFHITLTSASGSCQSITEAHGAITSFPCRWTGMRLMVEACGGTSSSDGTAGIQ